MDPEDKRLLEASASGQTDGVLQLLEEPDGHQLHKFKGQKISEAKFWCLQFFQKRTENFFHRL